MAQAVTRWPLTFDPSALHVRFIANKVALGHGFLRALLFYPVNIMLTTLHTYLNLQSRFYVLLLPQGQTGEGKLSKKQCSFGNRGALEIKAFSLCVERVKQQLRLKRLAYYI
jgi:hypothetical protein